MEVTLNAKESIIREFKTKFAAKKFVKRLLKGGYIKEASNSFYGNSLNTKNKIYQVIAY